jgi:thioredoxin 2
MDALVFVCPSCLGINRVRADRLDSGPTCGRCHTPLDTSGAPLHVSDDALDKLVQKSPVPVLVDFYADWCGPCRALAPTLETFAKRHAGEVVVAKVDTERFARNAQRLGVRGIPAVFLFAGGQKVADAAGLRPLAFYEDLLRRAA